jgi:uncharacterized protein YjdB
MSSGYEFVDGAITYDFDDRLIPLSLFGDTTYIPGSLWAFGHNEYGQLGDNTTTHKSSDAKIAVAKSDKNAIVITGVKDGSAMITITDRKGVTGKVAVTVRTVKETPKTPKGLDFDKQSITVSVGKDGIVTVKGGAQPYSAVAKDVNIATVSVKENKVNIRGVKAGKTTITVTDKDKKTGTINVTVK